MTTTTQDLLTAAEDRAGSAASTVKAQQKAVVDSMRDAIGRGDYDLAKVRLAVLEESINHDFRPFVARVQNIAHKAGAAIPAQLDGWLSKLAELCDKAPAQLRDGIAAFDSLTFNAVVFHHPTNGLEVDVNKRAELIGHIRRLLRSHDGMLSFMESQKAQAEHYIREANWPAAGKEVDHV